MKKLYEDVSFTQFANCISHYNELADLGYRYPMQVAECYFQEGIAAAIEFFAKEMMSTLFHSEKFGRAVDVSRSPDPFFIGRNRMPSKDYMIGSGTHYELFIKEIRVHLIPSWVYEGCGPEPFLIYGRTQALLMLAAGKDEKGRFSEYLKNQDEGPTWLGDLEGFDSFKKYKDILLPLMPEIVEGTLSVNELINRKGWR